MRLRLSPALCLASALAFPACDAEPDPDFPDTEFRMASTTPGDGDLTINLGSSNADDPDLLIWDIVDVDAYEGPADQGNLILSVQGDDFVDAAGIPTCHRWPVGDGSALQELQTADGAVVYTVKQKWIFYGRVDVANPNFAQLAYTIKGDQIYEGSHTDGEILVTASENIEQASDMRKLLLAVLIEGKCGAPGL